jgi:ABC-type uncharacterized transport system auxiliary subunit
MKKLAALLVIASILAGCASTPQRRDMSPVSVVASPYEPAAQFGAGGKGSAAEGAVIGAAGGAGIGAMSAKASAGLLCTLGGPLCWIVMVPAAIVGGVIGGLAGGAVDALTTDPGNRIADARGAIEQAVAEMRLTDALAAQLRQPDQAAASPYTLEVGVTDLAFLAREKDMAVELRARSRLYRASDGALLDERTAEARTGYRKYQDWAADEALPLRRAIDEAIAQLGKDISPR